MMKRAGTCFFRAVVLFFCWSSLAVAADPIRYVALGDSYTIGTGVIEDARFPNQLVHHLKEKKLDVVLVDNLARGGETSEDLLRRQLPLLEKITPAPDFITVLIGTNDWVQGRTAAAFKASVETIFSRLRDEFPSTKVVVIGSPDFASTPGGKPFTQRRDGHKGIQEFNAILCSVARAHTYPCVTVFALSTKFATDFSMLASDALHPSGAQYLRWVEKMAPTVERILTK